MLKVSLFHIYVADVRRRGREAGGKAGDREGAMSRDIERVDQIVVELWRPRTIADWVDHLVFGRGRYQRDDRERIRSDAEELLTPCWQARPTRWPVTVATPTRR